MKPMAAAALLAYAFSGAVFAQPESPSNFGKTDMPRSGELYLDIDYKRTFERDLDNTSVQVPGLPPGTVSATGMELDMNAVLVRIAVPLYSVPESDFAIEAYALLGAVELTIEGSLVAPPAPAAAFKLDGDWGFAAGGGIRTRVLRRDRFAIFLDGSARWSRHNTDIPGGFGLPANVDIDLIEWQISAYASYTFDLGEQMTLAPYGGVRVSGVNVEVQSIAETDEDDIFGVMAGLEWGITRNFAAFVEGHFIDELALRVGGSVKF